MHQDGELPTRYPHIDADAASLSGPASLATPVAPVAPPPLITETGTRVIMVVNAYRDKGAEIDRKQGGTLIGTLRIGYGSDLHEAVPTTRS
jgi:hypothetical protein